MRDVMNEKHHGMSAAVKRRSHCLAFLFRESSDSANLKFIPLIGECFHAITDKLPGEHRGHGHEIACMHTLPSRRRPVPTQSGQLSCMQGW